MTTLIQPEVETKILSSEHKLPKKIPNYCIWNGDVEEFIVQLPQKNIFDLIISSPPYNIGKPYEEKQKLAEYVDWQKRVIKKMVDHLSPNGSICWQIGNYVENNSTSGHKARILPLDYIFHPIFDELGLILRNRIIWRFGHGLHCKTRFSGRYEVILWYTKNGDYTFNLDAVRLPSKYPAKKHFKGPNIGKYSGNPLGKNPEDVWVIPNVKSNHVEKTIHPCQFPVGLAERLVLSLSNPGDLVFDPFMGVASAGVASALHGRRFIGCELREDYSKIGQQRINNALLGNEPYRPHNMPVYDHTRSKLSLSPWEVE